MNLVTGASGFVGSHLVKHLTDNGEKVVSVLHDYKLDTNKWLQEALRGSIKVRGDVRDIHFLKRVLNQYSVSRVFHLAAQSIVKQAWKDPVNTFDINVLGTVKLLEACRQLDVKRVMVQSTDKVYGNQMDATINSPLKSTEPYGSSKICVDIAAQTFIETYGMNIVITRCCNIYGYDWNNRIIPNTIRSCLKKEDPIIFEEDKSKRQYVHISDVVTCFTRLMNSQCTREGIVNVAVPEVKSQEEVVLEILKRFPELKPRYIKKTKLKEIHSQSMQIDFINIPYITFEEGIEKTVKKFRKYGF